VTRSEVRAATETGGLVGWVEGSAGIPVLLLHGGPGLSCEYLDSLAAELGPAYRTAAYQQRGVAPSTTIGPFDLGTQTDDAVAVLDSLGWDRAFVVGHSWGGHLAVQLARRRPDRLAGALVVDPLGAVGDGGAAGFEAELLGRAPEEARRRSAELDAIAMAGEGTVEMALEGLRLVWPGYFADPTLTLPFGVRDMSVAAYASTWEALVADLPALEDSLSSIEVPMAFVHGERSPIPVTASSDAVALLPDATLTLVEGAGHFPWFERPGSVRDALDRLVARTA
jgi:pimeloyl-ACP methyl ester carboxylesterase